MNKIRTASILICAIFAAILTDLGCAPQKKEYQRPPSPARENGLPLSGNFRALAVADLDNDGNLDIIGGGVGTLAIWYGNGHGGFPEPLLLPIKGDIRSLAAADVNGDGLKDIVFSIQKEASGIQVWNNQPGRKWVKGKGPIEGNNFLGIKLADINGDGHHDIIAANTTSDAEGGIQIWLGDGKGNWPVESGPTINGRYMDAALADLDGDGNLDLIGAGWGTYGALRVWFGNGTGNWSYTPPLDTGSFNGVTVTDINGDGKLDILAGTYRGGIRIFLGDGKGNFVKAISPDTEGSYWKVLAVDLDEDGSMELLASSIDSKGIKAWKKKWLDIWTSQDIEKFIAEHPELENTKIELWEPIQGLFPSSGNYYEMAIADLNNDGQNDLCAASFGEGVRCWMGKGGLSPGARKMKSAADSEKQSAEKKANEENEVFTSSAGFAEYKIGPGDILEITMWKGTTGTKEEILVRPDGMISFAFMKNLVVTNLTPTQLDEILTRELKVYIKEPRINVVVKKFQSKYVTLIGEIFTNPTVRSGPGKYELTGKISLLEMLSKAGGPTQNANLRDIRIRRKNGQTFSVDLYKVINFGEITQDIILDDGDLVFIPTISKEANRVYVFGEVEKPGVYTFSGSEMRLFDAVSQAGGMTIFAFSKSTKVIRGDITGPEVLSADLQKLMEEGDQTQNFFLANGDLVYIPRSFIGDVNLFLRQISPILNLIAIPARVIRDYDTSGEVLRLK